MRSIIDIQELSTSEIDELIEVAKDIIANPVNPFTGKPIGNEEKTAHDQYITLSSEWDVNTVNGNTFNPSGWAKVSKDLWDADNWEFYLEKVILKDYQFPTE